MSQEFVRNILTEQRKRMVGSLMQYLEREVYPKLSREQQKALREKVLNSTVSYHDVCLDVLKASVNDGSVINEEAVRLMAELNTRLQADRRDRKVS
jgi:hypothetical protein